MFLRDALDTLQQEASSATFRSSLSMTWPIGEIIAFESLRHNNTAHK